MSFLVGQRVRVYESSGIWDGTVENVNTKIGPGVTVEFKDGPRGFTRTVFAEQCRRLRKRERSEKRERVECWGRKSSHAYGAKFSHSQVYASKGAAEKATFHGERGVGFTLVGPPIRLVEVRPGEVVISRAELANAWEKGRVQDGKIDFADAERSKHFADMCAALNLPEESK